MPCCWKPPRILTTNARIAAQNFAHSIFGSALRADFRPDSDVDVLISFSPQAHVTLFDMARMQEELKTIFGRNVDLVSKRGVENSRNYLRRKAILESAQVIHAAR
ncbi:MAG: nucleotidyltransferase domain-containing protein [Chloroflexi bacterium]|nr:nucleotidyltransferase domain-containing protein [Chloroflexota bacterium]